MTIYGDSKLARRFSRRDETQTGNYENP